MTNTISSVTRCLIYRLFQVAKMIWCVLFAFSCIPRKRHNDQKRETMIANCITNLQCDKVCPPFFRKTYKFNKKRSFFAKESSMIYRSGYYVIDRTTIVTICVILVAEAKFLSRKRIFSIDGAASGSRSSHHGKRGS